MKEKYLKLFGERLLVEEEDKNDESFEKSKAGIYVPQILQNDYDDLYFGFVRGTGTDCSKVDVGDYIVYTRDRIPGYFNVLGKKYIMIAESNIIGVYYDEEY